MFPTSFSASARGLFTAEWKFARRPNIIPSATPLVHDLFSPTIPLVRSFVRSFFHRFCATVRLSVCTLARPCCETQTHAKARSLVNEWTSAHARAHTVNSERARLKLRKNWGRGEGKEKKLGPCQFHRTRIYTQESVQVFSAQTREQTLSRARVGVSAACVLCRKRVMEVAMEGWSESGEDDGCRTWVNYREKINTGPDSFD